jgi:hypothetical protein
MSKPESIAPIVHIHAPRYPHDAVEIIGSRKGLERIINTLIEAVDQGHGVVTVESADGHASHVCVTRLEGRRRPEEWRRSGSPMWDVDDPFVARIVDLTEENDRLRDVIALLRRERKSLPSVDVADDGVANKRVVNE